MPSDSMNIAVSGLDAYQAQIDVVSNNIANVGTTAYKGSNVTFQDLFYQTQQPASAPTKTNGGINNQQIGIGVKVGSTDVNLTQGGVQTTGVSTNMMVNGDGYFILNNADGSGSPKYTRNGDFSLNDDGLLYDPSSGLAVQGYTANSSGTINAGGAVGAIQIPIGLRSQATATGAGLKYGPTGDKVFDAQFGGNLSSTTYAAAVSNGGISASSLASVSNTVYDSLGQPHELHLTFQPVLAQPGLAALPFQVSNPSGAAVTAATEWSYTVTSDDGTLFANGAGSSTTSGVQYAFFDQAGQFINTSATAAPAVGAVLTGAAVHQANGQPSIATGDLLSVTQWGTPSGAQNAATPGSIAFDLESMTSQAAATSQLTTGNQNGYAPGTLSNVSVGQDGTITGAFTNGQNATLARVALATFQNEQGLTRIGASQYTESSNSGQAIIGTGNSGRFGAVVGDSLELSNVSIADEFTKLITAQNAFTANSKSITTANEDDQTVVNLIH